MGSEGAAHHSSALEPRLQCTLFVPAPWSAPLEALRRRVDPVQAALIAAHVTLCREDEFAPSDVEAIFERSRTWEGGALRLVFGAPERFLGHGVLLPCVQGAEQFQRLRQWLLSDRHVRVQEPHLTLAHPRNPQSPHNTPGAFEQCPPRLELEFGVVTLIRQSDGAPWSVVGEAPLGGGGNGED